MISNEDTTFAGVLDALTAGRSPDDASTLKRAFEWLELRGVGRRTLVGQTFLSRGLGTAATLAELKLDTASVAASLLADLVESAEAQREAEDAFGATVAALARQTSQMKLIEGLAPNSAQPADPAQLERLRKMLLAMVQDVRVVIINLAQHTQTMRFVVGREPSSSRAAMASRALHLYAPLANRLGIGRLKWELEDLALRVLESAAYKQIARLLDEKRVDRELYIEAAKAELVARLEQAEIGSRVVGRAKHIYSIYRKMQSKNLDFDSLYDVRALRVLVASVESCYAALSVIHDVWTPVAEEFDDYIAHPKTNDYRSLHTAVIGPHGKVVEIQIRTHDMHRHAELGMAAHWAYKEGRSSASAYDLKLAALRQILEWKSDLSAVWSAPGASELFSDTIYVLTPQGRVIDLPRGATPIDFAYRVHTELGHGCRGARINGVLAALNTQLATGQLVEIITAKQGGPSRDWLNQERGFVRTNAARSKVRQWFNRQHFEEELARGREIVDRQRQRYGGTAVALEKLARDFNFGATDDFLAALGRSEITPNQVQRALQGTTSLPNLDGASPTPKAISGLSGILVGGVDKLLTVAARCCKPLPPDLIIGFVSRGRGVTIHRHDCVNLNRLPPERLIEAQWNVTAADKFSVDIVVDTSEGADIGQAVAELLSRERIDIQAARTASRGLTARFLYTVEIGSGEQLARLLGLIRGIVGVISAKRR